LCGHGDIDLSGAEVETLHRVSAVPQPAFSLRAASRNRCPPTSATRSTDPLPTGCRCAGSEPVGGHQQRGGPASRIQSDP
jgi:hypothetical protein